MRYMAALHPACRHHSCYFYNHLQMKGTGNGGHDYSTSHFCPPSLESLLKNLKLHDLSQRKEWPQRLLTSGNMLTMGYGEPIERKGKCCSEVPITFM